MDTCKIIQEQLFDYPDRLNEKDRLRLELHLKSCSLCQREWREMQVLQKISAKTISPPSRLREQLLSEFDKMQANPIVFYRKRIFVIAAAILLLFFTWKVAYPSSKLIQKEQAWQAYTIHDGFCEIMVNGSSPVSPKNPIKKIDVESSIIMITHGSIMDGD